MRIEEQINDVNIVCQRSLLYQFALSSYEFHFYTFFSIEV